MEDLAQGHPGPRPGGTLTCHFAEALCLGIGEYWEDQCLPKAVEDAEGMASAFRHLGCCNVAQATKEPLIRRNIVELVSEFVHRTKLRMQEVDGNTQEPLLVALFVASHGIHGHGKDMPLIVPADLTCSSNIETLIDLDKLVLNELAQVEPPRQHRRKCCVWIILDTCRSGPITAWQSHVQGSPGARRAGYRGPHSQKTSLTPDFLFVLACDPGGWASDSDSLSSALVRALQQDGVSIRDACEHAIDAVKQHSRGRQRPWMNQRAGTTFSRIRKVPLAQPEFHPDEEVECVPLWFQVIMARVIGLLFAALFLCCFFGLFFFIKIGGAEKVSRGEHCPDNSCFCTDCHHRDIYSSSERNAADFDCQLWQEGPIFNRCSIAQFLHVFKIAVAVALSRKSWLRLLGVMPRDGATPLDMCVILVSGVNILTSVKLPLQDDNHVILISYSYGILNFAFISASISMLMLIHAEFPRTSHWSGKEVVTNFTSFFLTTSLAGQALLYTAFCHCRLDSLKRAGKQEMLFYAFHVFTAALTAVVGFSWTKGSDSPVAKKSWQLLCVSLSWMVVVVAWLLTSYYAENSMAKYHLLRILAERACNFGKIALMVWFSEHSIRCRGASIGSAQWRMRAASVQAYKFQCETAHVNCEGVLVQDQFHIL